MRYVWVILALMVGFGIMWHAANAAECTPESTGLKYVKVGGSGLASAFFLLPLVALAPLAYPLATNDQYVCHVKVIGNSAAGFYKVGKPK